MAMSLIAKNLAKQAIGTHVMLICDDGEDKLEKIEGIITDNDFTENVELTLHSGEVRVLDYSLVKKMTVTQSLKQILMGLSAGTKVRFAYSTDEDRTPAIGGVVLDNDGQESLQLRLSSGEEELVSYSLIGSLVVTASGVAPEERKQPVRATQLYEQKIESTLNASDIELKNLFDTLPREDRIKLSGAYDSFKYGIKINSREKMENGANQASQILFREDNGHCWSSQTARFCGLLLRRVNVYDSEVFLQGGCYWEAALVCYREQNHVMYGAYSLLALMEFRPSDERIKELLIMAATGITKADDISGLRLLSNNLPEGAEPHLQKLIAAAFSYKGIQVMASQPVNDALNMLDTLYPNSDMAAEMKYWNPELKTSAAPAEEPVQQSVPAAPQYLSGIIKKLNWINHTGVIVDCEGVEYSFRYQDISNVGLQKTIAVCLAGDLDKKTYMVKFKANGNAAFDIQPDISLVDKARMIMTDHTRSDRCEVAYEYCKQALESADASRALSDLIAHTNAIYKADPQRNALLEESIRLYEKHAKVYPCNTYALMNIAQCYCYTKKYSRMLELARKANTIPNLDVRQKIGLLTHYLRMVREYYDHTQDKALLMEILTVIQDLELTYRADFQTDRVAEGNYKLHMLHHRIFAECELDMLEEAEADLKKVPDNNMKKASLEEMVQQTRARLMPEPPLPPEETAEACDDESSDEPEEEQQSELEQEDIFYPPLDTVEEEELPPEPVVADEAVLEVTPYEDKEGWDALHLTAKGVIDYALNITGPERIPAILAYLKAGSMLKEDVYPVYRTVALAANDPMEAPNYSITALEDALACSDSNYPELNDCCMGAAFLRASFLSDRGYDYSSRGLRNSIAITQNIPALSRVYDTLEEFRKQVGRGIDIYADYRNHGTRKLMQELEQVVSHAGELYTKFVLTAPREGVKFARLLSTKLIVFAKDGYLATMLRYIMERDNDALEAEKGRFVSEFLNGIPHFCSKHISETAIDSMITECWDKAGKSMQMKKANSTLQGDRRNNLRSNISAVLSTICQRYALAEQSAGLEWRTKEGSECYQELRPQLLEELQTVVNDCQAAMERDISPEYRTGLYLLADAAREMSARLDGSWSYEREKFMYVDFLRSENVMLNDDFLPELESTFCALPKFNILARIRSHVEGPKMSFQEHIDRIYGMEKTFNNYGTAEKIVEYVNAVEDAEKVTLRDNAEQFAVQTRMQIDIRYRSFCEQYALAMNYGQIMASDHFCYTLEDTVRYWFVFCSNTKNYGFLANFLMQAEAQIHASAQQYEEKLGEQLDELIAKNQEQFDENPGFAEAIRELIALQNFIVAEDWMHRIRLGDFSLELKQPEALGYLEHFWNSYVFNYNRVADNDRPLSDLLGRRAGRGGDTERAQQMIDHWISGPNSGSENIAELLNLLGWKNVHVKPYHLISEPSAELYEAWKERDCSGMTAPLHPIAAFGSNLEKQHMYVSCLYGTYDCDRLYEKMRSLDALTGSKVILLDYALGGADRRALARKLKRKEFSLRNVYLVIDRVLICHLANIYNENLINRILMATAMPFTYCQPYVVDSAQTMPPEIFIGRKDELQKIEQADGVNLIYGGRQLGKSALLKKALLDLDGNQQQRAVLIDINKLNCASSARFVSDALIKQGITPGVEITDDWDILCQNIEWALRDRADEVLYFLLMLDEADDFIDDCANYGYRPLVALKNVQQSLPGRFKYVCAGLHNIVKFNRQVALGNNSVIPHMSSLKITPFRSPEAQELLTFPLSYLGFSIPSKVTISQIAATCNYFPGLMQMFAKMLIESMRSSDYAGYDMKKTPPYVITDNHLRKVMADRQLVAEIHRKFEITLTLDQDQGSCYYPLTLLIGLMYNVEPSKGGYTAKDILRHAHDLSVYPLVELDEEKIDALLQELQDLNILRSVSDGCYLLASKNFRDLLGSEDEILEKLTKVGVAPV